MIKTGALLSFGLMVSGVAGLTAQAADTRPNIVVIMSDDSGYTDLGCYGGEIDTPNIDKLSTQGIRLSSFYSNGRCSPTRASLLTGLDCGKVGFGGGVVGDWSREMPYEAHRGRLPYKTPLISELLKESGYRTLMSGKWHMGGSLMKIEKNRQKVWKEYHKGWELTDEEIEQDYLALPMQRGFDEYFGLYGAQDSLFFVPGQHHVMMEGNKRAKLDYSRTYKMHCISKWNKNYNKNHGKEGKAFYATDGVAERAAKMIKDASGKNKDPFFLYVAQRAPHKPLQAPEELVQKYLKRYADLDKIAEDRYNNLVKKGLLAEGTKYKVNSWKWKQADKKKVENFRLQSAIHAAMIEKIDEGVGTIVKALKDSGEYDNTLILYFSDNGSAAHIGELMNVPYNGVKALLWEGGTKTHFIASWPGKIKPGTISHEQAWVGDLLPTFLDISGTKYPKTFRGQKTGKLDGRNMMPVLMGEKREPAEAIFFNDKGQQSVVFKGRWKLLIEPGWYLQTREKPGIAYELYDLQSDPSETKNLAHTKPEMVKELAKMCDKWKVENKITDYSKLIKLRPRDPY